MNNTGILNGGWQTIMSTDRGGATPSVWGAYFHRLPITCSHTQAVTLIMALMKWSFPRRRITITAIKTMVVIGSHNIPVNRQPIKSNCYVMSWGISPGKSPMLIIAIDQILLLYHNLNKRLVKHPNRKTCGTGQQIQLSGK